MTHSQARLSPDLASGGALFLPPLSTPSFCTSRPCLSLRSSDRVASEPLSPPAGAAPASSFDSASAGAGRVRLGVALPLAPRAESLEAHFSAGAHLAAAESAPAGSTHRVFRLRAKVAAAPLAGDERFHDGQLAER
jgi:hypothetical protein